MDNNMVFVFPCFYRNRQPNTHKNFKRKPLCNNFLVSYLKFVDYQEVEK